MIAALTGLVLAAFVGYAGAWYAGRVEGNFALLLLMATTVTGVYWVAEKLYFWPKRQRSAQALQEQYAKREQELMQQGIATPPEHQQLGAKLEEMYRQPWWLDWTAGLFPVIAAVFILRSFLFEPFKIPSGSMIPTLHVGDLILVNKFHYGIRLPVINHKLTDGNAVQRGDVMVFRYPPKPSLDYIKRVIGIPGDEIAAFVVEPVQGEGGYIVPDKEFFPRLKAIADKYCIAIVVDEVQSGAGRTGKMWAIENFGIEPDIVAAAKGLGSGMPIGAVIAKEHWMRWKPGSHGSTFGGNPVAAAAAIARASPLVTSLHATRLGIAGFTVGYAFLYDPGIMLRGGLAEIVVATAIQVAALTALCAAYAGFLLRPIGPAMRIALGAAGLAAAFWHGIPDLLRLAIAAGALAMLAAAQLAARRA